MLMPPESWVVVPKDEKKRKGGVKYRGRWKCGGREPYSGLLRFREQWGVNGADLQIHSSFVLNTIVSGFPPAK